MKKEIRSGLDMTLSPITPEGQPVFSTMRPLSPFDDPNAPVEITTPEPKDAIKVLQFLDQMNGISWTPELKDLEKKLRDALIDFMGTPALEESKSNG